MPRFFLVPPFHLGGVVVVVDDGTAEAVALAVVDLMEVDLGITDDFFGDRYRWNNMIISKSKL